MKQSKWRAYDTTKLRSRNFFEPQQANKSQSRKEDGQERRQRQVIALESKVATEQHQMRDERSLSVRFTKISTGYNQKGTADCIYFRISTVNKQGGGVPGGEEAKANEQHKGNIIALREAAPKVGI